MPSQSSWGVLDVAKKLETEKQNIVDLIPGKKYKSVWPLSGSQIYALKNDHEGAKHDAAKANKNFSDPETKS